MASFPTPAQSRAIEEWWARHPRLKHLMQAMTGIMAAGALLVCAAVLITGVTGIIQDWPTWKAYYQYAGGWSLRLETPTGPPVTVSPHNSQESCEQVRAGEMQRTYRSQRSVPSLSCAPQYQGWRRLHYAWQATMATRTPTPTSDGR
jgi:hypothetical protein